MKLTSNSPLLLPGVAAPPAAAGPAHAAQRPALREKDRGGDTGSPGHGASERLHWRPLLQAGARERESLTLGFEFTRTLTRGRITGLQTALRVLTQPPAADAGPEGTTRPAGMPALPDLRRARVSLCDRLQAQYALFLANPAAAPDGLPRSSRGSWRRSLLRQLLQEDLDWVRSLPGENQDLVRTVQAGLDRSAPHDPL